MNMTTAGRRAVQGFAAIGAALTGLIAYGIWEDAGGFDTTRGGYEAPYTDFTGEPMDWSRLDLTATGMVGRGRVVNVLIDCTNGMMHFELFGFAIPFREFSPRAIAVHRPREACKERGFEPRF